MRTPASSTRTKVVQVVVTLSGRRISALKGTWTVWARSGASSGARVTARVPESAPLAWPCTARVTGRVAVAPSATLTQVSGEDAGEDTLTLPASAGAPVRVGSPELSHTQPGPLTVSSVAPLSSSSRVGKAACPVTAGKLTGARTVTSWAASVGVRAVPGTVLPSGRVVEAVVTVTEVVRVALPMAVSGGSATVTGAPRAVTSVPLHSSCSLPAESLRDTDMVTEPLTREAGTAWPPTWSRRARLTSPTLSPWRSSALSRSVQLRVRGEDRWTLTWICWFWEAEEGSTKARRHWPSQVGTLVESRSAWKVPGVSHVASTPVPAGLLWPALTTRGWVAPGA